MRYRISHGTGAGICDNNLFGMPIQSFRTETLSVVRLYNSTFPGHVTKFLNYIGIHYLVSVSHMYPNYLHIYRYACNRCNLMKLM